MSEVRVWDPVEMTLRDYDLLRTFCTLLSLEHRVVFTVDDFTRFGLDRFLVEKQHGTGGLFAKWQKNGYTEKTGKMRYGRFHRKVHEWQRTDEPIPPPKR